MILHGMLEWEEWQWEKEVQAMAVLKDLFLQSCKLRCIPSGLATHANTMKKLTIYSIRQLHYIENFASVVELDLYELSNLTRISNFPKLQKLEINRCQNLESLQEMNALRRFVLTLHYSETQLPMYLRTVKPSQLLLDCSLRVLASMALEKYGAGWEMFSHIQHVEAHTNGQGIEKRWHLLYTSEPYSMETNIDMEECSWSFSKKEKGSGHGPNQSLKIRRV